MIWGGKKRRDIEEEKVIFFDVEEFVVKLGRRLVLVIFFKGLGC